MIKYFLIFAAVLLLQNSLMCQPVQFNVQVPEQAADVATTPIIFYGTLIDKATSTPIIYPNILQQLTPKSLQTRTTSPPILRLRARKPSRSSQYLQLRTNVKGEFKVQTQILELEHVTSIIIESQKHVRVERTIPTSDAREVDLGTIYLEPRIQILGRLIDEQTKQPLDMKGTSGRPYIYVYGTNGSYVSSRMTPLEDGRFVLQDVAEQNVQKLMVRATGYISQDVTKVPELKDLKMNFGNIAMQRSPRLKFELFDKLTNKPYVPASRNEMTAVIAYSNNTGQFLQRTLRTFFHDGKGNFEAELTVKQVDQLVIGVASRQPIRLTRLPEMKDNVIDAGRFVLEPVQMIFGRLKFEKVTPEFLQQNTVNKDVVNGYTATGLIIPLKRAGVVRESGIVQILEPPSDLKAVEIWVQGFLPKKVVVPKASSMGLTDLGMIELKRGCIIKGRAVGPKDEPVVRGTIFIMGIESLQHAARTDSEGNFELSGLKPGKASVIAMVERKDGNSWISQELSVLEIMDRRIKLKAGVNKLNLRFELPK